MANPSLQIGNSKWAIKKDNLLGYSTAGTRFLPIPITMTRASAGTRVNPKGLVETVELLGSELVSNGDFEIASGDVGGFWTTGTGWAILGNGLATRAATGTNFAVDRDSFLTINQTYKVVIVVEVVTSGNVKVVLGATNSPEFTVAGTYTFIGVQTNNTKLRISPSNDYVGSVSNISVKEVTRNDLARVDYTGSTSSLLAEPQRTNEVTYSENFSDSSWIKSGVVITNNNATSPDGTLNASTVNFSVASQYLLYQKTMTTVIGGSVSISIYTDTSTSGFISFGGATPSGTDVSSVETLSGGFYRHKVTRTFTVATTNSVQFIIFNAAIANYVIWGAQLEEGSYATSYIPTSGSTVTRVQDQYSKTGISDKINSEQGTLFVDVDFDTLSGTNMFLSIRPDSSNKIEIYRDTNIIYAEVASSNSFSLSKTNITVGRYKIAFAYSSGSSAMYINGDLISSNSVSFTFTSTLNNLNVNSRGTQFVEQSRYKDIKLYKTRLSNSELATLTTI